MAAAAVLAALLAGCGTGAAVDAGASSEATTAAAGTASTEASSRATASASVTPSDAASATPSDAASPSPSSPAPASTAAVLPGPSGSSTPSATPSVPAAEATARARALEAQLEAAQASASSAGTGSSASAPSASAASSAAPAGPRVMAESAPVRLRVPSIGVDTELLHLGLREDGSLDVPPIGPGSPAGWYTGSPTPGELGPAILMGHVNDTEGGEGVFAHLAEIQPGATVEVTRADGSVAVFRADGGQPFAKDAFPTELVYGNTDDAQLRLITCDGYNRWTGRWEDNYVAFATLVG